MLITIDREAGVDPIPSSPVVRVPPDKSVLHRVLLIGSLTHTNYRIAIPSVESLSHDIVATVLALESLGVPIELFPDRIELQGVGLHGLAAPSHKINCANSGTTARLLMGLLVGQPFDSVLVGDKSLSARPMKRLATLLNEGFGARIKTSPTGSLPVVIEGTIVHRGEIVLPVASAQMKSAALLAGLYAEGVTSVTSPLQSRDHTERMLEAFGCDCRTDGLTVSLRGPAIFTLADEASYVPPGDLSSAAFLIAAAILLRVELRIEQVLLNPTRTRFLDILTLMGVELELTEVTETFGEAHGTISVHGSKLDVLKSVTLAGEDIPLLIDELPIIAVLAAFARGKSRVSGAVELRFKESDRIRLLCTQMVMFGVGCLEYDDGFSVEGDPNRRIEGGTIDHGGDHRIAMAFAVMALRSQRPVICPDAEVVSISFPGFFGELTKMVGEGVVRVDHGASHEEGLSED